MILKKQSRTEEDRARALAKEREKQRKKMIKTRYGQKQKKHARKGVQSCLLAVVAAFILIVMITGSFSVKGHVGMFAGVAGIAALIIAWRGLVYGTRGFKERDKNYITCRVGTVFNGVLLLLMCGLFIRGLF